MTATWEGRKQQNKFKVKTLCPYKQLAGKPYPTDVTVGYPVV